MLGATLQQLIALATWQPGSVHPCNKRLHGSRNVLQNITAKCKDSSGSLQNFKPNVILANTTSLASSQSTCQLQDFRSRHSEAFPQYRNTTLLPGFNFYN